jgi:hypothetical protein
MCSSAFGSFSLIHAMSRYTPPCGEPRPAFHLAIDTTRDVISRQQLRRTTGVLVALGVPPALSASEAVCGL